MFKRRTKVFCVGRNKTGTTSLELALVKLGYRLGHQPTAEKLIRHWKIRDFSPIVKYCRTADAFQDIPFSLDYTFQAVDYAYAGSKFILTVRENAEIWYKSLVRFHAKIIGVSGTPTVTDLKNYSYSGERGFLWGMQQVVYGVDESTLYDPQIYKKHYDEHNARVVQYFADRPSDLLVLNIGLDCASEKLCHFLGKDPGALKVMPHLNVSKDS